MGISADIVKRLKHFTLRVSLCCPPGEILSIVGPSGAGKTTILRMLAGLDAPDSGSVSHSGETWVDRERKIFVPAPERKLAMVFQEYPLFPHLNVYRNVCFTAPDKAYAGHLMERFGIWHLKDSRPDAISGGEKQRCAICQALARQPRALLMDEPFSALDPLTRRKLRESIRGMKAELGIPVVHVTHDIREALFLADEIMPVVKGRVDHKWLLQFMLTAKDGFQCREYYREAAEKDMFDEIELPIRVKEY